MHHEQGIFLLGNLSPAMGMGRLQQSDKTSPTDQHGLFTSYHM